jgi:hypothetical protein
VATVLSKLLESKYEGLEINFEEAETQEPYVDEGFVSENSQLSGLRSGQWNTLATPGPMQNISAEFLIRSVSETVQNFITDSE